MSLKRQKRKLKIESAKDKETLVERLDKLFQFLDEEYGINAGGCCFAAYCLAKLLSRDKVEFSVVVYEVHKLVADFNKLSNGHYHYAIMIGNYCVNSEDYDDDPSLVRTVYSRVKASDILNHYKKHSWNECYDVSKNNFILKAIKMFYNDLTEDLREG